MVVSCETFERVFSCRLDYAQCAFELIDRDYLVDACPFAARGSTLFFHCLVHMPLEQRLGSRKEGRVAQAAEFVYHRKSIV
jgi:hypothetical protein